MSVPVNRTNWKNLYSHIESREYEDLNNRYFQKFGEHLDFSMFPEDITVEKFESDVMAAIAADKEIVCYYCPSCHNHESGIEYTDESPCNLCGFPTEY